MNLRTAFFLNLAFTLLEVIGGFLTNSVAILSDAVHDLGDTLSLGLAWKLDRVAQRSRDQQFSYGYRRFSLLGAIISTVVLILGSMIILIEAIPRLFTPESANAQGMILFALLGVVVNGIAALRLRGEKSLNARAIAWHLIEDVLGWVAVLVVSIVLLFTDFYILDPLLSIFITIYILYNVLKNLKQTLAVFLQAVPENVDVASIDERLNEIEHVCSTHHTHVWSLDGEHHVLTSHIVVDEDVSKEQVVCIRKDILELVRELAFAHSTIEIEFGDDDCGVMDSGM
ncbi:MAG: cation diffusion facilitator family transporter [Anaerolineales bacterium]|nr:cation diffusion facilitator family transporter [Anaerolineales bacterium]